MKHLRTFESNQRYNRNDFVIFNNEVYGVRDKDLNGYRIKKILSFEPVDSFGEYKYIYYEDKTFWVLEKDLKKISLEEAEMMLSAKKYNL